METVLSRPYFLFVLAVGWLFMLPSCSVLERSSRHDFESGFYRMKTNSPGAVRVYADVNEEELTIYETENNEIGDVLATVPLSNSDSLCRYPYLFIKSSLDIDIVTILLKFRPSVYGLPVQMDADFNGALYAGWRYDQYQVSSESSPLGRCSYEVINRGYDLGLFGGLGTTAVNAFTTRDKLGLEYNALLLQGGLAAFIESRVASFGLALGYDYLVSPDRKIWIYDKKPWLGFVIGFPLN